MKVAYLFESTNAREILENMIIPQLEKGIHGADVVGMMFFFDNCYMLVEGNDIANRLSALAEKTGSGKKDAEKALNAFVDVITEALAAGEKVQIVGFGSYEVKARPARTARNPRTGEEIKIEASKTPVFKAGKALKDIVNK